MWRNLGPSRAQAALTQLTTGSAQGHFGPSGAGPPNVSRTSFEPHLAAEELSRLSAKAGKHAGLAGVPAHHHAPNLPRPALPEVEDHAYQQWRVQHPCALSHLDDIRARLKGKRLAVFLDYDGTLTPIVSNPDEAFLSQQMRETVRSLARLFPTAIISGRGREKVENFVQLKELYYAGSHGMDIAGPTMSSDGASINATDMAFQPAAHFRPMIDSVYRELCEKLASIPGSSVEHNTFCVSAHFRNCSSERWQDVVAVVEQIVGQNPELRMTRGRKVVEVRPKVNWHKGTALEHLLGVLGLRHASDVVSIYIGDDHTDEDAFKVLRDTHAGFGILVSTKVRETAAAYTVRDPAEVGALLQALVSWGFTQHNGWSAGSATSSRAASSSGGGHVGVKKDAGMVAVDVVEPLQPSLAGSQGLGHAPAVGHGPGRCNGSTAEVVCSGTWSRPASIEGSRDGRALPNGCSNGHGLTAERQASLGQATLMGAGAGCQAKSLATNAAAAAAALNGH